MELKKQIYKNLADVVDKDIVVAWSGGPYSTFIVFMLYRHLSKKTPLVFFDTGEYPIKLYPTMMTVARELDLDYKMVQVKPGTVEKHIKDLNKKYDVVLTGKEIEDCYCPLPDDRKVWNLIKILNVPYFSEGVK